MQMHYRLQAAGKVAEDYLCISQILLDCEPLFQSPPPTPTISFSALHSSPPDPLAAQMLSISHTRMYTYSHTDGVCRCYLLPVAFLCGVCNVVYQPGEAKPSNNNKETEYFRKCVFWYSNFICFLMLSDFGERSQTSQLFWMCYLSIQSAYVPLWNHFSINNNKA